MLLAILVLDNVTLVATQVVDPRTPPDPVGVLVVDVVVAVVLVTGVVFVVVMLVVAVVVVLGVVLVVLVVGVVVLDVVVVVLGVVVELVVELVVVVVLVVGVVVFDVVVVVVVVWQPVTGKSEPESPPDTLSVVWAEVQLEEAWRTVPLTAGTIGTTSVSVAPVNEAVPE